MNGLRVHRLGYALGASVEGVDLSRPLDDRTVDEIQQVWLRHLLVCFPNQDLSKDDLLEVTRRLGGEVFDNRFVTNRDEVPEVRTVSTGSSSGRKWEGLKAGRYWHSDLSYCEITANGTLLYARELPSVGGDTLFANLYTAYETLSPAMQALVSQLSAVHDQAGLYERNGARRQYSGTKTLMVDNLEPAVHPVVRTHPETGRKVLYVGDRLRQFDGMTEEESRPLLDFLTRHATRYEFTYRHRWRLHDLIVWDNRCMLHHAPLDYDPQTEPRLMWRTIQVASRREPAGTPS